MRDIMCVRFSLHVRIEDGETLAQADQALG